VAALLALAGATAASLELCVDASMVIDRYTCSDYCLKQQT
jgi:hypothetical protein